MAQRDHVTLWPLTLAPVADAGRSLSPYTKFKVCRPCHRRYAAWCVWALMGLVTLTVDLLTLKLVCESHPVWGAFLPNLAMLGLWVIELFATYATDGRTNKSMGRGVIKFQSVNDATDHCQHWLWASGNTEGGHLITYAYKLLTRIMSVFYRFYLENFGTCVRKRCFSPLLTHEWSETFWYCEA